MDYSERYDLGGHNFSNQNLQGANFSGSELAEANFSGADLTGADLSWTGLVEADFTGATLTRADFTRANLNGAILENITNLEGVILTGATIVHTRTTGTDLTTVNLSDSQRNVLLQNQEYIRNEDTRGNNVVAETANRDLAFQIHRFSSKINTEKFNEIIKTALDKNNLYRTIENPMNKKQIKEFLFSMIEENFTDIEKMNELKRKLHKVLKKFGLSADYSKNPKILQQISNCILYVSKQPKKFRQYYITTYIEDTYGAYNAVFNDEDTLSCVAGIVERFITTMGTAIQIICIDGKNSDYRKCKQHAEYYEILKTLNLLSVDIQKATQEWAETVLDTPRAQKMTRDGLKKNYILFLKRKYKEEDIEESVYGPLIEAAVKDIDGTKYAEFDVFKQKHFGGGSKNHCRVTKKSHHKKFSRTFKKR